MTLRPHQPTPRSSLGPWTRAAACALLAALAIFLVMAHDGLLQWGGDNAMYLMHARNLVEGAAYNATGYIQNPHAYLAPPAYPPGFPLALAPIYALAGLNLAGLTLYASLIGWAAVALFIGSIRHDLTDTTSGTWAWLALIPIIGCDPLFVRSATALYSDGFFLLTLYAALWGLNQVYERREHGGSALTTALWVGALAGLCATTRVFGLLLFVSIPIFELYRYRRLTIAGMLSIAAGIAVYGLITLAIRFDMIAQSGGSDQGYSHLLLADLIDHASQLPATVAHNVQAYVYYTVDYLTLELPGLAPRTRLTNITVGITLVALAIGLIGYIRCLARRPRVRDVFCAIYILSLLPWMATAERYLLPVVPILLFYIVIGLQTLSGRQRIIFPALIVAGVLVCATTYATAYTRYFATYPERAAQAPNGPRARALYHYIERHTAPDAVFVFRRPRLLNLFTRRAAATYADALNPMPDDSQMLAFMASIDARYLITGEPPAEADLDAFVARHPARFERVYRNTQFTLYRVAGKPRE